MCESLRCTLSSGNFCFPRKLLGVSAGLALKSVLILSALRGLRANLAPGPVLETAEGPGALPAAPAGLSRVTPTQGHRACREPQQSPGHPVPPQAQPSPGTNLWRGLFENVSGL